MPPPDLQIDPNQGALTPLYPFVTPQAPFVPISSGPHAQPPAAGPTLFPYVNPAFIPGHGAPGAGMPGTDANAQAQAKTLRAEELGIAARAAWLGSSGRHKDAAEAWGSAADKAFAIEALASHEPDLHLDAPDVVGGVAAGEVATVAAAGARARIYQSNAAAQIGIAESSSGGSAVTDSTSTWKVAGIAVVGAGLLYAIARSLAL